MKTLNRKQRKMVIECFANECAEEMPADDDWEVRDSHMDLGWMGLTMALDQSWREPRNAGWYELIEYMVSAMQLDRDPAGHLNEMGWDDTEANRDFWKVSYDDYIGATIDAISSRAH